MSKETSEKKPIVPQFVPIMRAVSPTLGSTPNATEETTITTSTPSMDLQIPSNPIRAHSHSLHQRQLVSFQDIPHIPQACPPVFRSTRYTPQEYTQQHPQAHRYSEYESERLPHWDRSTSLPHEQEHFSQQSHNERLQPLLPPLHRLPYLPVPHIQTPHTTPLSTFPSPMRKPTQGGPVGPRQTHFLEPHTRDSIPDYQLERPTLDIVPLIGATSKPLYFSSPGNDHCPQEKQPEQQSLPSLKQILALTKPNVNIHPQ